MFFSMVSLKRGEVMKTTKIFFIHLTALILLMFGSVNAQDTYYHESWVLDKEKSTIQGRMTEWLVGLEMVTTIDGEDLKIECNYKTYDQDVTDIVELKLGGEEVTRDFMGIGKIKSRAKWDVYQESVIVNSEATFTGQNGTFTFTQKDHLSLSEEGENLILKRETDSSSGTQNHTLIFNKKE